MANDFKIYFHEIFANLFTNRLYG